MEEKNTKYYVPHSSIRPIMLGISSFILVIGIVHTIQKLSNGIWFLGTGLSLTLLSITLWFKDVIHESLGGLYNKQMDRSFRWGMIWFIFTEVFFFGAFFGAFFYARLVSVPMLAGLEGSPFTQSLLYPDFEWHWPLLKPPLPSSFTTASEAVSPWGLPLINTFLLLSSGLTITFSHYFLLIKKRWASVSFLLMTIGLGLIFLFFQFKEYMHAIYELNLTLKTGVYGSAFYMLTGFHGFHVFLGALMLTAIMIRTALGHFDGENHFGFEAVTWYWHFVDVVWLFLFVFVYWV